GRRLIVVLASLEAAGLETPLTEKGKDFRQKLRADFKELNPDLKQKMKFFIDQYAKRTFSKQRQILVDEKKSADELKKFDDDVKAFFDQLENYRSGKLS